MLTDRDYELLSTYIDGTLSASERADLEARLQTEVHLRHELDELRATVALVNSLPILKAPRDFTLNAQEVWRPASRWLIFPTSATISMISAAAATILISISALLLYQNIQNRPSPSTVSDTQSQAARQEIAMRPTQTPVPSEVARTATALSINSGLTITAEIEETQKQFPADSTVTGAPPAVGQANSASSGESDITADQVGGAGAALPFQAPAPESEAADALLPTDAALQFAPSEDTPQATALPPGTGLMLEAAATATPELDLSRERQGTPTPLPTSAAAHTSTATRMPTITLSLPPPTSALLPATQVAIAATIAPSVDVETDVTSPIVFPLVLLVAGLALVIIAIGTTLARRRQ